MKRILLADDNEDLLSALRLLLETRLGVEVISEARDMQHVLAQMEDARPNWILLDWELPGRPSRERAAVLRMLVPGIKIIAISARPESAEEALCEGVDAFFSKVESPERILEIIEKLDGMEESV
jgi:DNA-binding NarL/FixJ family response regulator